MDSGIKSADMSWSTHKIKRWYHHWSVWVIVAVAFATFLTWPKIKNRYHRWSAARQVRHAAESIAQKDFKRAILEARSVLETNPLDAGATEIMAKALEGAGSGALAVQWRSRLDTVRPGDVENLLAWANDSLKGGDVVAAERILGMLKPEPTENASYHAAAAAVAMAKRDAAGAERHWAEASRIEPEEDLYRLKLAGIRLVSKSAEVHAGAVAMLKEISGRPANAAEALRALLGDARAFREWNAAREYADALVATHGSVFQDKLARLDVLRAMKSRDATGYLTDLRNDGLQRPADLYMLLMWMNQHDLALLVADWVRTTPQEIIGVPPVCVAVADAYVRSSDWRTLLTFLEDHTWGDWEYMRRAFLARATERTGEGDRSTQEWKDGLAAARSRGDARDRLERMTRLAIGWGWEQRAQEVMWAMAGSPGCPRWMLDALWLIAIENTDAAQLQRLAGMLAKADPKSVVHRNNYAFYSLLTRAEEGDPHREAERLFSEDPKNADIVLTRGLSLYQQGKSAEAAALTGGLSAEDMKKPRVTLYHAIFLTGAGESAKAQEWVAVARQGKMLPEEKAMLERAKVEAGKAAEEMSVTEESKAMRAAKAAKAAAEENELAEATKAARAARAALAAEKEKAVEEARAARAAKAAKEAAEATK